MKSIAIEDYLSIGSNNAHTREELANLTSLSDREVRRLIADARRTTDGPVIISSSDTVGYWLAEDIYDADRFIKETNRRIRKLQESKRSAIDYLGREIGNADNS